MVFDAFRRGFRRGGECDGDVNTVLRALGYGRWQSKDKAEEALEARFQLGYEDASGFNMTAVVANKLASIVCSEAVIGIRAESGAAAPEFLDESLARVLRQLKTVCARVFGTGGVVLKPFVQEGQIYTDVLPQSRFYVLEAMGERITKAVFLAESFRAQGRDYLRAEIHTLDGAGNYVIENRALCNLREVPLAQVGAWAAIEPVVYITGVEQPLFAFLRCPVDGRGAFGKAYGVPVTYGCEQTMAEISSLYEQMQREFELKKTFIGSDVKLFDDDDELVKSGLYKRFSDSGFGIGDKPFWEVFSPEIRQEAYIAAINFKQAQLERAIGVNKGILTDLDTADATATAIRRSTFDTFNLTDAMRREIELACEGLLYAYGLLGEAFGIGTTDGERWQLVFDWSYGLIEEPAETFAQLMAGFEAGIVKAEEIRQFLFDGRFGGSGS